MATVVVTKTAQADLDRLIRTHQAAERVIIVTIQDSRSAQSATSQVSGSS